MMKRWYWILVVAFLVIATAAVASAQSDLVILKTQHSYVFNEELVFELELENDEPIPAGSVELLYSLGHDSDVVNRRQPEYEPRERLALTVRQPLERGEIPPATQVTYHWEITDAAGHTVETDTQAFLYMDDRFDWHSETKDPITIYWYGRVDGEHLLNAASEALSRLEDTIKHKRKLPIKILVYQDRAAMQATMPPRGGDADDDIVTIGRVAAPDTMLVLNVPDVENVLGHELSHMVVGELTENPFGGTVQFSGLPLWLDEGLAMYNQDYVEQAYRAVLGDAARNGELHTIRRLVGSTRENPRNTTLWYAEAWSVVDYLINEHGEEKMSELLDVFSKGAHPDDALREVYGFDRDGLTVRWWEWLGAEVPPELRDRVTPEAERKEGDAEEKQRQVPTGEAAATAAPAASQKEPASESPQQPTGTLACCLGLLPLGLIVFSSLRLRNRHRS